ALPIWYCLSMEGAQSVTSVGSQATPACAVRYCSVDSPPTTNIRLDYGTQHDRLRAQRKQRPLGQADLGSAQRQSPLSRCAPAPAGDAAQHGTGVSGSGGEAARAR